MNGKVKQLTSVAYLLPYILDTSKATYGNFKLETVTKLAVFIDEISL